MPTIDVELLEEEWDADFRPPRGKHYSVAATDRIDEDDPARVVAVDRGRVTVLLDDEILEAAYGGSMRGTKVAVGDDVRVRRPERAGDAARVTALLDRRSVLRRTSDDAVRDPRLVAANVDQVVVVLAGDHLDGGTRFLDRVLVAAEHGGMDGLVVVNRIDVADAGEVDDVIARYEAIGYEGLAVSALTGEGIDRLRWRLEGVWSVLSGHSGVGKSSLYNHLVPDADQAVAAIGPRGGRHTTVAARAERVAGLGDAWVVDTPGVRSFGIGFVEEHELAGCFPELAHLPCAHDDCRHDGEPGCAVARAMIHPARLAAYRRLLSSLRGDDSWERDEWAGGAADVTEDTDRADGTGDGEEVDG